MPALQNGSAAKTGVERSPSGGARELLLLAGAQSHRALYLKGISLVTDDHGAHINRAGLLAGQDPKAQALLSRAPTAAMKGMNGSTASTPAGPGNPRCSALVTRLPAPSHQT